MVNIKHGSKTKERRLQAREARKPSMKFKLRKLDPEKLKRRGDRKSGHFDSIFREGVDTYRPKQGDNNFRILPPTWDNADHFGYTVWVHGWIGPGSGSYLCPLKMKNKKCPICAEAVATRKAGEDEEARQLEPKEQIVYYVLDKDEKDDIPKLYAASWSIDRDICSRLTDKKTGETLYIYHPQEGYDIFVKRIGQQLQTRYIGLEIDRNPSAMCDDEKTMENILEQIEATPIPSLLVFKDEKYLRNVLEGAVKDKDEDLEEDEDEDEDESDEDEDEKDEAEDEEETDEEESDEEADEDEDETDEDDEEEDDEDEDEDDDEEESREDEEEDEEEPVAAKRRNGPDERTVKKPKKEERLPRRREREERATRSRR